MPTPKEQARAPNASEEVYKSGWGGWGGREGEKRTRKRESSIIHN